MYKFILTLLFLLASLFGDANISKPLKISKPISVKQKKQIFLNLMVPIINDVHTILQRRYQRISKIVESGNEPLELKNLIKSYGAKDKYDLLIRLKPHPKSITIAQAAMESGWGTSRFAKEANNIFGIWSIRKSDTRIAANKKRGKKTIYLKKYDTIFESVKDYYRLLASKKAFKEFRKLKVQTNDPYILVTKLDKYSERGVEYTQELATMIRYNKFFELDK